MENYLNSKINKRKNTYNTSSSKKNNCYYQINYIPKEISKTLKYTNDNIKNNNTNNNINNTQDLNSLINVNFNSTLNNNNQNVIINNPKNKKVNNTTNGIYYINSNAKNYKQSHLGQKPIILCYDQMKYDSYFVTPKNTKKLTKGKVQTSNKSTKYDSNSRGVGTNNTKNQSNKINKQNDFNIMVNTLIKTKNN